MSEWHAVRVDCHTDPRMLNVSWDRIRRLFGETIREVGILIIVFAPLETAFAERAIGSEVLTTVIVGGLTLIVVGVVLEARD